MLGGLGAKEEARMKLRSLLVTSLAVSAGMLAVPADGVVRAPAVWSYPGAAPCDTSLQACFDATAEGDVIRIVANVADPGSVNIDASITIEGDPALDPPPRLGNASTLTDINIDSDDPLDATQVDVTIRNSGCARRRSTPTTRRDRAAR
jgi:hypothetical protein